MGCSSYLGQTPAPPSPEAFHGLFGEIVERLSPETEADPTAILVHMLAMFGNVIGRGPHSRVGADRHHLNLFACIVGPTAKARKGMSRGEAQRLFGLVDPEWVKSCITSGMSSGEGLIWAVRDQVVKQQPIRERGRVVDYQLVVEDAGVGDKRLLVVESELASTLKVMSREGNTLSPVIRQAWDGEILRTLTKTSAAKATESHIAIIGHITRDELRRHLSATEAANGFGNRFIWVFAKRSRLLPDGGHPLALEASARQLREAVQFAGGVTELRRDDEARTLWHGIYARLSAGRPGMLGAMTARGEAQVMRLACLYALADRSAVICAAHLRAALELWRYCFDSARYLFGGSLGDPVADEILRALAREWPGSLSRREILHNVLGRNVPAREMNRALTLLEESQLASHEDDRSSEGRPAERWFAVGTEDAGDEPGNDRGPDPLVVKVVGHSYQSEQGDAFVT